MEYDEVLARLEIMPEQAHSMVQPDEGRFLHDWIKRHSLTRTLEIGFACGGSTAGIMSAHDGQHVCMDPYQEYFQNVGLRNIEKLGFRERLRFLPEPSHAGLPMLLAEGRQFDFAFVDGKHLYDGIMIDFYFVDLLLAPRGYVLFHDTWMRATQLVARFIETNRSDYRSVPCPHENIAVFQKTGTDTREWDHFEEFYSWTGAARGWMSRIIPRRKAA